MSQTITPPKFENSLSPSQNTNLDAVETSLVGEFLQETLAMTKRLFIQLQRRPSSLAAGVIQPLMLMQNEG